jgi:hypothetical protein
MNTLEQGFEMTTKELLLQMIMARTEAVKRGEIEPGYWGWFTLQGANLRRANLEGADLEGANLERANLRRANLRGASLRRANLRRASLREANLRGANLRRANLEDADMRDADLRFANLERADLRGANLRGADMRRAGLDFSCWPLWCGTKGVVVDSRIAAQLAAHFCAVVCDDPDAKAAQDAVREFARKSHRAFDLEV